MEVNKLPILGQKLRKIIIDKNNEHVLFFMENGDLWCMYHEQDCCESVGIEDIEGNGKGLHGILIQAEEVISYASDEDESTTWTFYKFAGDGEYLTIRWVGTSNGYYSESVSFKLLGNLSNVSAL